jgi:hypothetical protein
VAGSRKGKPNVLSKEHVRWEIIEKVSSLTKNRRTFGEHQYGFPPFRDEAMPALIASHVIRKRRSAVDFDRKSSLMRVWDIVSRRTSRLNRLLRFQNGVDIAMRADQMEKTTDFGIKYLEVTILK